MVEDTLLNKTSLGVDDQEEPESIDIMENKGENDTNHGQIRKSWEIMRKSWKVMQKSWESQEKVMQKSLESH